jgi:hypothetical protein
MTALRIVVVVTVLVGLVKLCTGTFEKSRVLGVIVSLSVVLRALVGFGLLAAAHSNAAFLRAAQAGGGFWTLAPDARVYFELASRVAAHGPSSVGMGIPSPVFVTALGMWLWATGVTLASVVLFNIACYAATAATIVYAIHQVGDSRWTELMGALVLSSFGFSPLLILATSQALKDPLFVFLIVLTCVSTLRSFELLRSSSPWSVIRVLGCVSIMLLGMYGITGIRPYYGFFLWLAYGAGVLGLACVSAGMLRVRVGLCGLAIFWLLWVSFTADGETYYQRLVARTIGIQIPTISWLSRSAPPPSAVDLGALANDVAGFRQGFIRSGGNTNLVDDDIPHSTSGSPAMRVLNAVGVGTSAMFVPISVLRFLSIVTFHGGRGLLVVTDIDTIFLDITLVVGLVAMYRGRARWLDNLSAVAFLVVLIAISGGLLAYVVTNFGTLFRLRMLTIVPAWIAPVTLCRASGSRAGRSSVTPPPTNRRKESSPQPMVVERTVAIRSRAARRL